MFEKEYLGRWRRTDDFADFVTTLNERTQRYNYSDPEEVFEWMKVALNPGYYTKKDVPFVTYEKEKDLKESELSLDALL